MPLGNLDLDNVGSGTLADFLMQQDPEHLGPDAGKTKYTQQADAILSYRDRQGDGLIRSFDALKNVADPAVVSTLEQKTLYLRLPYLQHGDCGSAGGRASARASDTGDAVFAVGMLVYLWFRFELIYGVAAVVAVFHDTIITIGRSRCSTRR